MKKFLLPLLTTLLFTACQKQISTDKTSEEIAGASTNKQAKFTVCHYDAVTGISKTIEVTQNALSGHLAHGDLQGSCSAVLTTICDQDWMVKNLDVDHYRNGDPIPQVTDLAAWHELTTGAWCYYENNTAYGPVYGKLYNWYAVNDPRGLAPAGWHVPNFTEWTTLYTCLDAIAPTGNTGGKMKSIGTLEEGTGLWFSPNEGANNISGFTGLPGGWLFDWDTFSGFQIMSRAGVWWTSTEYNNAYAYFRFLRFERDGLDWNLEKKQVGASVRCVRD